MKEFLRNVSVLRECFWNREKQGDYETTRGKRDDRGPFFRDEQMEEEWKIFFEYAFINGQIFFFRQNDV